MSPSWCSSGVASGKSCSSLFSFCSVGGCCSTSPCSDGQSSRKLCLLWHLPQQKTFPWKNSFLSVRSVIFMKPGIRLALLSSFERSITCLISLSIRWLKTWDCSTTSFTTPNRLDYKTSSLSEMSCFNCTATSCIEALFACTLYV